MYHPDALGVEFKFYDSTDKRGRYENSDRV